MRSVILIDHIVNEGTSVASFSLRAHLKVKPLGGFEKILPVFCQFEVI